MLTYITVFFFKRIHFGCVRSKQKTISLEKTAIYHFPSKPLEGPKWLVLCLNHSVGMWVINSILKDEKNVELTVPYDLTRKIINQQFFNGVNFRCGEGK